MNTKAYSDWCAGLFFAFIAEWFKHVFVKFLLSQQKVVTVFHGYFLVQQTYNFFRIYLCNTEKICFLRARKTFFIKMIGVESVLLNTSVLPAYFETWKTHAVELVGSMGRNGQRFRMRWVTLTVAFFGDVWAADFFVLS